MLNSKIRQIDNILKCTGYFLKICTRTLQLNTSLFQKWLKVYWKKTLIKLAPYIYIQKKASHCLLYVHEWIKISLVDQFQKTIIYFVKYTKLIWFKNEILCLQIQNQCILMYNVDLISWSKIVYWTSLWE